MFLWCVTICPLNVSGFVVYLTDICKCNMYLFAHLGDSLDIFCISLVDIMNITSRKFWEHSKKFKRISSGPRFQERDIHEISQGYHLTSLGLRLSQQNVVWHCVKYGTVTNVSIDANRCTGILKMETQKSKAQCILSLRGVSDILEFP